jgi:DNA polymerase-1
VNEKFFILDTFSLIHQSYYAVKTDLTSPDGLPVKAVYGFLLSLRKILFEEKPSHLAAAMDSPATTFRKTIYPQYKATRKPMPDDLVPQIDIIKDFLRASAVPMIEKPGFEADDVIGALARRAEDAGFDVFLVSRDKDLKQLLSGRVKMYNSKDGALYGTEDLRSELGLAPSQMVDYLALHGDAVDNIPGVPGVGEKTAGELLKTFSTLDGVYERIGEIGKKKLAENLANSREEAFLSRKLATIRTDLDLGLELDALRVAEPDAKQLRDLYVKHGFQSFLKELPQSAACPASEGRYECVNAPESFERFIAELSRRQIFALDTESTGTDPHRADLVGMSFSWEEGKGWYVPVKTVNPSDSLPSEKTLSAIGKILLKTGLTVAGHNLKYDICLLSRYGISIGGRIFDTMIAAHLVQPAERGEESAGLSLDALARDYLQVRTLAYGEVAGSGTEEKTLDMVDLALVTKYAAEDADLALRLKGLFEPRLSEYGLKELFENIEMPLVKALAEMESRGVKIDVGVLDSLSKEFGARMDELIREIFKLAGCEFNLDSPKQLSEVLFGKLKLPPVKKTKTGFSTDHDVLETLSRLHPVPAKIVEYRTLAKLKNTYVDVLGTLVNPRTGRVHTSFNQAVTSTGRLSSTKPNLQNIPIRTDEGRRIRAAFVPADAGRLILTADYSQVELRILAHFSKDENLREAFAKDLDIHTSVAAQLFGTPEALITTEQRRVAKTVNFGIIYGQTPFGLSKELGIPRSTAEEFIFNYFNTYRGVKRFIEEAIAFARENGYVATLSGRRRRIGEINSADKSRRAFAERTAVNTVIQGTAADLIKIAMINIHKKISGGASSARLVLQIHDELVFEVEKKTVDADRKFVEREMVSALTLDVPLKVSVAAAESWLEAK